MTRTADLAALGLSPGASDTEIRSAFRQKALHHHPDLGGDAAVMTSISEAYQRLIEGEPPPRPAAPSHSTPRADPDDEPDNFTIGHSMLAFVVVPVILALILLLGVFSVLSTIL